MDPDLERRLLRRARLRRSSPADLTICRKRRGKGFCYVDDSGIPITDRSERDRLARLAVPPAWRDVRLAPSPNLHLQACGTDARARVQYRYHERWTAVRDAVKLERLKRFGRALPAIRDRVERDFSERILGIDLACAAAVRIIDKTHMRPGSWVNTQLYGTRGATTLLARDVVIDGGTLMFRFKAKGGKDVTETVDDRRLARILDKLGEASGRYLFDIDLDGHSRRLTANIVNQYLRDAAGGAAVSAKDFRTFFASSRAAELLAQVRVPTSERGRRRAIMAVARDVAEHLANTPAMARNSYIHPIVIETWISGRLQPSLITGRQRRRLTRAETALMRILEAHGGTRTKRVAITELA